MCVHTCKYVCLFTCTCVHCKYVISMCCFGCAFDVGRKLSFSVLVVNVGLQEVGPGRCGLQEVGAGRCGLQGVWPGRWERATPTNQLCYYRRCVTVTTFWRRSRMSMKNCRQPYRAFKRSRRPSIVQASRHLRYPALHDHHPP